MTPSNTAFSSVIRQNRARRTGLLAASALCGVAAMLAHPSSAGTLPGIPGAGSITVSSGGSQPVITAPDAATLQIDLNASRTVINWSSLHVSSGDTMNFLFDSASDIVLNKTTSQIAIDNGAVISGKVGAATGGNIWFYSPQGVIVSPGATMTAGGFVFAGGTGLNDATFVNAADPTAVLRAASNGLIRMSTLSSATSASVNAAGDVVLSASSGALSVQTAYGQTVQISTTSGSITASEVTASAGAATVAAGGPGATVTQITGATGVTVSSSNNSSVGAATTTTSGDILITSNGSASLTLGNSARDLTLSAPQVFLSTVDAVRSVYVTGTTQAYVTNRIFAGDDIEITADGNVTAGGAYLKATGAGADDSHILIRSTSGSASGGTLLTQGTGTQAGDITVSGATSATLTTGSSSRNLRINGASASVANAAAAGDVFVTASNGNASVTSSAMAGDDVEITASGGDVLASGATLTSTGAGTLDDAHVLARSTTGAVNVGSAVTQGGGGAAGDIVIEASDIATLGSASSARNLDWTAAGDLTLTGNYSASGTVELSSSGGAISQTGGSVTTDFLAAESATGVNLGGANMINRVSRLQAVANDVSLSNAKDLSITGDVAGRDVAITTTAGLLSVAPAGQVQATRDLTLTGATGFSSSAGAGGLVSSGGDLVVTATTGDVVAGQLTSSGSILVRALDGAATLRGAAITGGGALEVAATGTATLGADSQAGVATTNIVQRTGGFGTLDVASSGGDAHVFLNGLPGGLTSVVADAASGTASIGISGGFTAGTVSGHNVALHGGGGTVNAAAITVSGGDYTATAPAWAGAALNPAGTIRNLSITDTDGGLILTHALTATGDLRLESHDGLTSAYALVAGGDADVSAAGDIDLISTTAGDDILIRSTGGQVVLRRAELTGAGTGRDLDITATDDVVLGASDDLSIAASNVFSRSGGGAGRADLSSNGGDVRVHLAASDRIDAATAVSSILVSTSTGTASLGAATLTGTGTNRLTLRSANGDAVLGAPASGGVTSANMVTSANAGAVVEAVAANGRVDVNLDRVVNANLTTVSGSEGVAVHVVNGSLRIVEADSTNGAVLIDGPDGALTVERLTADTASRISGGGDVRLVSAIVSDDLSVTSVAGALALGDTGPGSVVDVEGALSLKAATGITQQAALQAASLGVTSGGAVVLLGDNRVATLDAVTVADGGFAFNDLVGLHINGPITAVGQTVELRSGQAVTQATTGGVTAQRLIGSSVGGAGFEAANQVAQLGDFTNTGGQLKLNNDRALVVDGAVRSTGSVALTSHGGMGFTANGLIRADGAGDAVVLASDGVFTNGRGADAVAASNPAGRWLIYTQAAGDPTGSTAGNAFNGLAGKSYYGAAYDFSTGTFAATPNAGNRFVYAYQPTLTVTPDSQVVTYDGGVPIVTTTISGLVNGDLAAEAWSGAATVSGATGKNVGTYVLNAGLGSLASDFNYAFALETGVLRIDARTITGVLDATDKTYDRTVAAAGSIILNGVVAGDDVSAAGSYAFTDWNAGVAKTVVASGVALSGADAGNYILSPVAAAQADILRRQIAVSADNGTKMFGQADPNLAYRITAGGLVAGDDFTGGPTRVAGEAPGAYRIGQGTLGLSANYDMTFTGAVFTIDPLPARGQDGSALLKHVAQSPDFTLDWDPEPKLQTQGSFCPEAECRQQAVTVVGGGNP